MITSWELVGNKMITSWEHVGEPIKNLLETK
jgi:hypothetical protein